MRPGEHFWVGLHYFTWPFLMFLVNITLYLFAWSFPNIRVCSQKICPWLYWMVGCLCMSWSRSKEPFIKLWNKGYQAWGVKQMDSSCVCGWGCLFFTHWLCGLIFFRCIVKVIACLYPTIYKLCPIHWISILCRGKEYMDTFLEGGGSRCFTSLGVGGGVKKIYSAVSLSYLLPPPLLMNHPKTFLEYWHDMDKTWTIWPILCWKSWLLTKCLNGRVWSNLRQ